MNCHSESPHKLSFSFWCSKLLQILRSRIKNMQMALTYVGCRNFYVNEVE